EVLPISRARSIENRLRGALEGPRAGHRIAGNTMQSAGQTTARTALVVGRSSLRPGGAYDPGGAYSEAPPLRVLDGTPRDQAPDHQEHNGSKDGDKQAADVEVVDTAEAECAPDEAADECANDPDVDGDHVDHEVSASGVV